jgi:4-amino-4-deoxy-L-arabinose transferase-like glycosyltransferase
VPLVPILAAYTLLHIGIRLLAPGAVEHDEAEQLLLTQSLSLGYGKHPPLYTWLQYGVFHIVGVSVLGLTVLKHACLLAVYIGTYRATRSAHGERRTAVLTALSLWLIAAVVWEAERDLTHSILAAALAIAAVQLLVTLLDRPTAWRYAAFGGVLGLGFLAKYNFALFTVALLAAALSLPALRSILLDRRAGLAVLAAGVTVGPHVAWAVTRTPSSPSTMLRLGAPSLHSAATGLLALFTDMIAFVGPLAVLVGVLAPSVLRPPPDPDFVRRTARQLLERYFVILVVILLLAIPLAGLAVFTSRWLLPLLIVVPLVLFLRLPPGGPRARSGRLLAGVIVAAGVLTLTGRFVAVWAGPALGSPLRLHLPFPEVAARIRGAGFRQGTILAADTPLGGNLRLHFPDSRVITPTLASVVPSRPGQCLVAWRPRPAQPTPEVLEFAAAWAARPLPAGDRVSVIEVPLPGHSGRAYTLELLALRPGPPPCERAVVPPDRSASPAR